jgi:hypothetical protein
MATQNTVNGPLRIAPSPDGAVVDVILQALHTYWQEAGLDSGALFTQPVGSSAAAERQQTPEHFLRASQLLRELREYCVPPEPIISARNVANEIEAAVQRVAPTWTPAGWATRLVCRAPLATLRMDWRQVNSAVERTLSSVFALLSGEEGVVLVESDLVNVNARQFIELRIQSRTVIPPAIPEDTLFAPFAQINGRQLGLDLLLARHTAVRLHGRLFFQHLDDRQGCFTLLLQVKTGGRGSDVSKQAMGAPRTVLPGQ